MLPLIMINPIGSPDSSEDFIYINPIYIKKVTPVKQGDAKAVIETTDGYTYFVKNTAAEIYVAACDN